MTDQEIDEVSKPFCGCWSDEDEAALDYRTFARKLLSRAIPEGHVVVPKRPTRQMLIAAGFDREDGEEQWEAMIAAAPANKEG